MASFRPTGSPAHSFVLAILLSLAANYAAAQSSGSVVRSTTVSIPATRPTKAYNVPPNFVGFGFAVAQLNDYDNIFSNNLVNSVADRMSVPPIIRVGGTNGDTLIVDPNQKENTTCSGKSCPYGSSAVYTVGPSFFEGFGSFTGAQMSVQAPFQPNDINNSVAFVSRAYKVLGSSRLAAIALGNEPNISPDNVPNAPTYVKEALQIESAVISALGLTGSSQHIFEAPDIANHYNSPAHFSLVEAFQSGLNNNGNIKLASEHYYQVTSSEPKSTFNGAPGTNFQGQIMNHSAIQQHFKPYLASLSYLKGTIPYALTETGSALVDGTSFTNSFGDCLWSVDFQLYAMSQGVARVDGSQRTTVSHELWQPVSVKGDAIGVRANYYAQPFIADFIDKSSNTWVANLDLGSSFVTAYAAYNGDSLARIALVNLHQWDPSTGTRPTEDFTLTLPSGISSVTVRRLEASRGAAAVGYDLGGTSNVISWAGETWSYSQDNGNGHSVGTASTTLTVTGGKVVVPVPDSEAVIVSV